MRGFRQPKSSALSFRTAQVLGEPESQEDLFKEFWGYPLGCRDHLHGNKFFVLTPRQIDQSQKRVFAATRQFHLLFPRGKARKYMTIIIGLIWYWLSSFFLRPAENERNNEADCRFNIIFAALRIH
jgi:hypothetical protein